MSDGPHRSLPMRRHWRNLAERAAKAAYSPDEVCKALPHAVKNDLREAPLGDVHDILNGGEQASLFHNERIEQLEALRKSCRGSVVSAVLIDCAVEAVANGLTGDIAFQAALANTCEDHARGQFRSMEEHYQRKSNEHSARYLRDRLDAAGRQCDFRTIASDIMPSAKGRQALHLPRQTGLDEGPAL